MCCSVFSGEPSGQATERKPRAFKKARNTVPHADTPGLFPSFCMLLSRRGPCMSHCGRNKSQDCTGWTKFIFRKVVIVLMWIAGSPDQPQGPVNLISPLTTQHIWTATIEFMSACSPAPPPTYSDRSGGITLSAFFKAESRPHWFLEEIVFITVFQTVPWAILSAW